jgi:hypothetical protein
MDLKTLRNEALEATSRFFINRDGILPGEDSDEWEAEYHRQFEQAKSRAATARAATAPSQPGASRRREWPKLTGTPAEKRWGAELRAARLKDVQSKELREWLTATWTTARDWVKTRDMPGPAFLRRVETQYAADCREAEAQAATRAVEEQASIAAADTLSARVQAAGITAAGLLALIDVSPRSAAASVRGKLAELHAGERSVRVFETSNPDVLAGIEKSEVGRSEYAIERDDGLIADLRLFGEAKAARQRIRLLHPSLPVDDRDI